jgi:NADH-quinone oxidoreductase subunit I
MAGQGFFKGMMLTFRHFINSYIDDFKYGLRRYAPDVDNFEVRQGTQTEGVFTVQYPDEKLAMPERFRFVPFLVVQNWDDELNPGRDWCTSCGICAKVCPPQCIWIVRSDDPETGRPVPEPEAFFIDIDICMNCGFCAEFCPFDAIKMDHDYEMASYDRTTNHIFDKDKLSKEVRYWNHIAPTRAEEEMAVRGSWEHKNFKKSWVTSKADVVAKQEEVRARKAEVAEAPSATAGEVDEKEARKQAALARKAQRAQKKAQPESVEVESEEDVAEKRRQAALARKAERAKRKAEGN